MCRRQPAPSRSPVHAAAAATRVTIAEPAGAEPAGRPRPRLMKRMSTVSQAVREQTRRALGASDDPLDAFTLGDSLGEPAGGAAVPPWPARRGSTRHPSGSSVLASKAFFYLLSPRRILIAEGRRILAPYCLLLERRSPLLPRAAGACLTQALTYPPPAQATCTGRTQGLTRCLPTKPAARGPGGFPPAHEKE